jgi:hypothetical protein
MNTYRHVREMLGHRDTGTSYDGERITKNYIHEDWIWFAFPYRVRQMSASWPFEWMTKTDIAIDVEKIGG